MSEIDKVLREIEARLKKSTPGPWEVQRFDNEGGYISYQVEAFQDYDEDSGPVAWCSEITNLKYAKPNAQLIASAPTDLARLTKALRLAVEGLEKLYAGERLADSKSALYKPFLSKKAEAFVFSALAAITEEINKL